MNDRYQPLQVEAKWQNIWQEKKIYEIDLEEASASRRPKFYAFAMFNYPSGEGIHVGHVKNFTISDVLLRFRRQRGDAVYSPVGFDAFGLPAENFALKTGASPQETITKAVDNYCQQYKACGFSFDWSKVIDTSRPDYYRWTQWCFLQLYKAGLAYQKESAQWWCEACQTVLADAQVVNGKCWRHDSADDPLIGRKNLRQWFFKLTAYADKMLQATPGLDWTPWVKTAQENYIGKSEGAEISFGLRGLPLKERQLAVFTTALDTIYGATFMVLAPEHPLVEAIVALAGNGSQLKEYVSASQAKSEIARQQAREKTGIKVDGLRVINPITEKEMTVWLADYVLASYGTGAIMGVPGADERDLEFAQTHDLQIIYPTQNGQFVAYAEICQAPEQYLLATDDDLNGLTMDEAKPAIFKRLQALKIAEKKTNFKLRDWLISRQRYWGAPIPIVYCSKCEVVAVPERNLPVELPPVSDYRPAGDGRSPLGKVAEFVNVDCPKCGRPARRETDTMDTYVCSSWYQMRYLSPRDEEHAWRPEIADKWFPVDFYNGGDHVTAHLIYARFFSRFFYEQKLLPTPEPFARMYFHAKINGRDGQPMSKSKGTGVDPAELINQGYGADALRVYLCAAVPPDVEMVWADSGVPAAFRFLNRVWTLAANYLKKKPTLAAEETDVDVAFLRAAHACIAKNERDLPKIKYNTALAAQMEFVNTLYKLAEKDDFRSPAWQFCLETLAMLLAPFAPHLASELWQQLGQLDSVHCDHWPRLDEKYLTGETIIIPVQVNGKLRGRLEIAADTPEEEVLRLAKELKGVARRLEGGQAKQAVYVPGKIINFVV